jgi:hypothetical protein
MAQRVTCTAEGREGCISGEAKVDGPHLACAVSVSLHDVVHNNRVSVLAVCSGFVRKAFSCGKSDTSSSVISQLCSQHIAVPLTGLGSLTLEVAVIAR